MAEEPDHKLEIESMSIEYAAYVDQPGVSENQPTIIWVSYEDSTN